jgi:hypothetical protein
MPQDNKVRIYKASYMLQSKVGTGQPDNSVVEKCQNIIENNPTDFAPMAKNYIDNFGVLIEEARSGCPSSNDNALIERMRAVIMELKANAPIFHFPYLGRLSAIMLSFLENIETLDKDALDIASAHYESFRALIDHHLRDTGDPGSKSRDLEQELKDACGRYYIKTGTDPYNSADAYYVDL